jgi:hypothetical protein
MFFEMKKDESVLFFLNQNIRIDNYFVTIFLIKYHNYMIYIELSLKIYLYTYHSAGGYIYFTLF